jgi:hypothetical protein
LIGGRILALVGLLLLVLLPLLILLPLLVLIPLLLRTNVVHRVVTPKATHRGLLLLMVGWWHEVWITVI